MMLATLVDTGALWKSVAGSFLAGVGVTISFSLAILGLARFADLSRDGRRLGAGAFAALGALALAAFVALIVVGIIVMTSK